LSGQTRLQLERFPFKASAPQGFLQPTRIRTIGMLQIAAL
jgi:hypothetical protein